MEDWDKKEKKNFNQREVPARNRKIGMALLTGAVALFVYWITSSVIDAASNVCQNPTGC